MHCCKLLEEVIINIIEEVIININIHHLSAEEWIFVHSCKLHEEKVITITARSLCTAGLDFFAHQSP